MKKSMFLAIVALIVVAAGVAVAVGLYFAKKAKRLRNDLDFDEDFYYDEDDSDYFDMDDDDIDEFPSSAIESEIAQDIDGEV